VVIGAAPEPRPLKVDSGERLLVVVPHPDDGIMGAGGLAQRVLERRGEVCVVLVTGGDGYVQGVVHETGQARPPATAYVRYGERRLKECRAAWRRIGGDRPRLKFLGFPDGELTTLLQEHWSSGRPECSDTTGACDPPYSDAVEPDAPYSGTNLRNELIKILRDFSPTMVVLPDPLDQHPDHKAAALFTLLAFDRWGEQNPQPLEGVRLLGYLLHWVGWPSGWGPKPPSPDDVDEPLELPHDIPNRGVGQGVLGLTDEEIVRKQEAVSEYKTQLRELGRFLVAFVRRTEPFTVFTQHDLQRLAQSAD
jgi:LmbE family N-acetylglucosaminyl deacetylase